MLHKSSSESGLIVAQARKLLRNARISSLATLETTTGGPYASLITLTTAADGAPIFLISRLAWHTRNLEAGPRASILVSEAAQSGDPLNVGRVSLMGIAERIDAAAASPRFLARHPSAAQYAGFADFSFWKLQVHTAHYVGGFGRIATITGDQLLLDSGEAGLWEASSDAVLTEMNETRGDLLRRLAAAQRPGRDGGWRMAACDPEGFDLVLGEDCVRVMFPVPLAAPDAIPDALAALGEAFQA